MTKPRSFLGHLVALRSNLEEIREYVRANGDTFVLDASTGTMAKADRTIAKIQGHLSNLDSELNSVAYQIIRRRNPR